MEKKLLKLILALIFILFVTSSVQAQLTVEETKIERSIAVLEEMATKKEQAGAFSQLLGMAEGVVIYPRLVNIGWGVGIMFGDGIALRKDRNTGQWYGPAFIEVKTASVGLQAGIQEIALVLILMDSAGVDVFKKTDFEIGADIRISPGPLGDSLQANVSLNDSIYSYSYSEGIYAGFSLTGSVIHADSKANRNFYGVSITSEEILNNKKVNNEVALKLIQTINRISQKMI
ncbi:MAG: lipid-binding SYLF domain-containing protein [Atribacterota bacterium]|jgi:lipid-binding SYLF domain-containing protein|nr:lipid-binding SYLF domain-containing protein [Atribacterota bacterium]MDD5496960.1 lipid-binding SYLF domain-containing protein [Atribacterota bacterium]